MTDFKDWIIIAAGAAAFLAMVALLLSAINGAIIGTQGSRANQAQCESIGGRYDVGERLPQVICYVSRQ